MFIVEVLLFYEKGNRKLIDAAKTDWTIEVNDQSFETEVLERSNHVPVVVDFWAPWCQPCRYLAPLIEAEAKKRNGAFVLAKVNVDENPDWPTRFQVSGIPAIRVVQNQTLVNGFDGGLDPDSLSDFIDSILPKPPDEPLENAKQFLLSDPDRAERELRTILETNPSHPEATLVLAQLLFNHDRLEEAEKLLNNLGIQDEIGQQAETLRNRIKLRTFSLKSKEDEPSFRSKMHLGTINLQELLSFGLFLANQERYPEALEILLQAAEKDKKLAANEIREVMLMIFQIIGVRSELSDLYRDKLRALLY